MKKKVFVFLFDGFSDWEIAYLTPELRKSGKVELYYFSLDHSLVTSMGGLNVQPSLAWTDIDEEEIDMLILPGGVAWEGNVNQDIIPLVNAQFAAGKDIAAICAATIFMARLGFLNNLRHTSNDLYYLESFALDYKGENNYQDVLAVSDQNIITADGTGPIEFAKEIFSKLGLYDSQHIEEWFELFKNGVWKG